VFPVPARFIMAVVLRLARRTNQTMPLYEREHLRHTSQQFRIYGQILHAELCKIGHINETYTATYDQGGVTVRYIHQKINNEVFKKPVEVMENVMRVTEHIQRKLQTNGARQATRRTLTVIPTHDGQPYYVDEDGNYWRTFVFVERVQSFESVQSPEQAFEAGRAFGEFQSLLADLPGERLHETIPDFHNTRKRFAPASRHQGRCGGPGQKSRTGNQVCPRSGAVDRHPARCPGCR